MIKLLSSHNKDYDPVPGSNLDQEIKRL